MGCWDCAWARGRRSIQSVCCRLEMGILHQSWFRSCLCASISLPTSQQRSTAWNLIQGTVFVDRLCRHYPADGCFGYLRPSHFLGRTIYPWDSGYVVRVFVTFGVMFIMPGIQQSWTLFTTASRRIIPIQFFKSHSVLILFSVTATSGASAFIPIYFVPIFFQFARGDGPLDDRIRLLPFIALMVVTVFVNGALLPKGWYITWYTAGGNLVAIGSALIYKHIYLVL